MDSRAPQDLAGLHHGSATTAPAELPPSGPVYKVYKRRFWGLAQLVLLNIVVSWDVGSLMSAAMKNETPILILSIIIIV